MKAHVLAAILGASAAAASTAWSTPAAAQQPGVADEVRLKDGSVFRGTITELVPKDHVDLLTSGGQTRRFAAADIAYAGPASRPAPAAPAPSPEREGVQVNVQSDQEDVQLLLHTGQVEGVGWGYRGAIAMTARAYDTICTAPCNARLPPGLQRLALSHNGHGAVEVDEPINLTNGSILQAHYESRLGIRVAGWLIGLTGAIVGVVLMATAVDTNSTNCGSNPSPCTTVNDSQVFAGVGVLIAGAVVGGIMAGIGDKATIAVVPQGAAMPLRFPGTGETARMASGASEGLALRLSF